MLIGIVGAPNNFQDMIVVNSSKYSKYELSNLQNVQFTYWNNTVIPSWLETGNSNQSQDTVYWLKIAPSFQGVNSLTVYMDFGNMTRDFFNNMNTGEAPGL